MKAYLRMGDDALEQATRYRTKTAAIRAYEHVARQLDRFGQRIDASVHLAPNRDTLAEYPDFVLSLGPRGGIKVERA